MSPRTPTLPPTEPAMWRKLLARTHPDAGGEHELFIWTAAVRDVVCSGASPHREEPGSGSTSSRTGGSSEASDRLDFSGAGGLEPDQLTARALEVAGEVGEPYSRLLKALAGCRSSPAHVYQERCGATYKQLALIAHLAGMEQAGRTGWYGVAQAVPLSQRHAGYLIERLQERAA